MKLVLLLALFFCGNLTAQVVNIESKRMRSDTIGWSGSAEASFQLSRTTEEIYDLGGKLHFQYKGKNTLWLFLNEMRLIRGSGTEFVNSGFAHVRYNQKVTKELLRWEAFVQFQYNKALEVGLRGLAGTGPRFKLYDSDNFRLYAAALYMFEYQESVDKTIIERNHRTSNYLSFTLDVGKIELSNTTYYQPNMKDLKDHRISSQTDLLFEIFENLNFKTGFTYRYDSRPFPGVPQVTFYLTNGIVFEF
jgi:Protein of unknown function, DUF481